MEPVSMKEYMNGFALVGTHPLMRNIYSVVQRIAGIDATVLITGESGTGKELLAHTIQK